ncbi:MAG: hypothetical protein EOM12_11475 [Verrucomicrobiae bacterium]|nr:hypothetical protein [Verrucomicrobiae bacterium]
METVPIMGRIKTRKNDEETDDDADNREHFSFIPWVFHDRHQTQQRENKAGHSQRQPEAANHTRGDTEAETPDAKRMGSTQTL